MSFLITTKNENTTAFSITTTNVIVYYLLQLQQPITSLYILSFLITTSYDIALPFSIAAAYDNIRFISIKSAFHTVLPMCQNQQPKKIVLIISITTT